MSPNDTQVVLLGSARLCSPHKGSRSLERSAAALLCYLALEGPTHRGKLAALLWPDSPSPRTTLRQALHRLRGLLGEDCLQGDELLSLHPRLSVDVLRLTSPSHAEGESCPPPASTGELLAGMEFESCPELESWLALKRTVLLQRQCHLLKQEAERLERQGHLPTALATVQRLLSLDNTSEPTWQQLMRLHLLLGDSGAALRAWRDCRDALRREVDAEPSEETLALAEQARHQARLATPRASPPPEPTPRSVLHPPLLVGREREWATLHAAWQTHQVLYVSGEAGIGKSRFLQGFCSHHTPYLLTSALPSDTLTSYATLSRLTRALVVQSSRLLPEAQLRQLARLAPELARRAPPLPATPGERQQLAEALTLLLRALAGELEAVVIDALCLADEDSLRLLLQVQDMLEPGAASSPTPHLCLCFRSNSLPPWVESVLRRQVERGRACWLDLEPLSPQAVRTMLSAMEAPELESTANEVTHRTGGNPFFLSDGVRALLDRGGLDAQAPQPLPLTPRIKLLLDEKLRRLSADALRLARLMALASPRFVPALATSVLGWPLERLDIPWKELKRARVLRGLEFTSGMLREYVLDTLSEPVREEVAQRVDAFFTSRT